MNIRIPLLLLVLSTLAFCTCRADSFVSAQQVGNHTIVVNLESGLQLRFGRNKGEGAAPFKARVRATVIEILAVLNQEDEVTDVTADIQ